ncbi:MAG: hypothetical protein IPK82_23125 [Polyangiaceae bacterium]|nr:hypothetical protein [Polyangiaceae bacterium]
MGKEKLGASNALAEHDSHLTEQLARMSVVENNKEDNKQDNKKEEEEEEGPGNNNNIVAGEFAPTPTPTSSSSFPPGSACSEFTLLPAEQANAFQQATTGTLPGSATATSRSPPSATTTTPTTAATTPTNPPPPTQQRQCTVIFRPGRPSDCLSMRSAVPWLGRLASSALFARFMHDIVRMPLPAPSNADDERYSKWDEPQVMVRDRDVERLVSRYVGSALVAVRYDQLALDGLGNTMNAKSVLQNALMGVLSPYGEPMSADVLIETGGKKTAGAPDGHLVDVSGKRALFLCEVKDDAVLNAVNLKNLTGGDVIKVRLPHGDYVLVRSFARLFVFSNHPFRVSPGENHEAIARRLIVVWFPMKFVVDAKWVDAVHGPLQNIDPVTGRVRGHVRRAVPNFEQHLAAEAPGTLRYLVRHCRDYLAHGLGPMPASCSRMTRKVEKDTNRLQPYLDASCECGPALGSDAQQYAVATSVRDLYDAYETWASDERLDMREILSRTAFSQALGASFAKQHRNDGNHYRGLRLKPDVARALAERRAKDEAAKKAQEEASKRLWPSG